MKKKNVKPGFYRVGSVGKTRIMNRIREYYPETTNIVDAEQGIDIQVLSKDVKGSRPKNHADRALARACKRFFDIDGAVVSRSLVYLIRGDTATRYELPSGLEKEIISFDRGAPFEPGEYHLNHMTGSRRFGAVRRKPPHGMKAKAPQTKRMQAHRTKNIRGSFADAPK